MSSPGPKAALKRRANLLPRSASAIRPPWSTEQTIREECTSCGHCLDACPEAILIPGPAKTPVINFARGECTFCGQCAEACNEDVFASVETTPWTLKAQIDTTCLMQSGVACRLCTDVCDTSALRYQLRVGGVGDVVVDRTACTGCGACVATCPVSAISVSSHSETALEPAE